MAGTGKTVIAPKQFSKTYNFEVPCEGAKVIPLLLDFATFAEIDIDLTQFEQDAQFTMLQTLYVNNSASASAMVIVIDPAGVAQEIVVNPNTIAYIPVLAPNPTLITISTQSGLVQRVHLINVPIAGFVFAATHP